MATVIAFPKRQNKSPEKIAGEGPATIIMFTGVRVERLGDDAIQARATPRRIYLNASQATAEELEA